MSYANDDEPLLPPKSRDGIERGVQWIFTGILVLALFVLIIVGIQFAERATSSLPAGDVSAQPKPIDIGVIPDE